ncbi:MAG: tetratricopeptide repeat protein [Treponema sp.]|nr:tetratricopeptide repeat protein [Treponema sp.]
MNVRIQSAMVAVLCAAVIFLAGGCATTKNQTVPVQNQEPREEPTTQENSEKKETQFSKDEFLASVRATAKTNGVEEALKRYDEVPANYADDFDIQFFKARMLDVAGRYSEAKSVCESLLAANGENKEVQELLRSIEKRFFMDNLRQVLSGGTAADALALYKDMPASIADDFDLQLIRGSLLVSENLLDEAEQVCNRLAQIDSESIDVLEIRLAIAERRDDKKARTAQLQALLKKDPYNAKANVAQAETFALGKRYKQARELYQKVLVKDPKNEEALFGVGQMDYFLEFDEHAKATFNKLLEVNPQNAQAYSYLGKLAYAQKRYKVAADNIAKALEIDPNNYDYNNDNGLYLRYLGKFDEAEQAWTKAIEIEPNYFLAYAYRAGLYDEQNKISQALADYKKVVALNPQYYYAYESIGILSLHQKNWTDARKAFFECRKYDMARAKYDNAVSSNKNKKPVPAYQGNISYPLLVTYCYYMEGDKKGAKDYSNSILRTMGDQNTIEYKMLRVFHDEAGEGTLPPKIAAISNINQRGKMYFYMGLFYDMFGGIEHAREYYVKVLDLKSPQFFEYRLAEWSMEINSNGNK